MLPHLLFLIRLVLARGAFAILVLAAMAGSVSAQQTRTVAGTFDFGYVGRQGKNAGVLTDAQSFDSLGLRIAFFVFDADGYDGTQGNDDDGFIRLITLDGQLIDISGAINWQKKQNGKTRFIGMIPDNIIGPESFSTPSGTYTIDASSSFAIRLPGFDITYTNGSTIKGSANPPSLAVIPTQEVVSRPGPPPLDARRDITITEGVTDVATLDTTEWVSWVFSGGADASLFDLDPATGQLRLLSPPVYASPSDADANNIYETEITAWDSDGESSVQQVFVTVRPRPADISSTKSMLIVANPGFVDPCDSLPIDPSANAALPGACIEYVIEVSSSVGDFGSVQDLRVSDTIPGELTGISIVETEGFSGVSLSGSVVTATAPSFDPGDLGRIVIRATIR